MKIVVSWDLTNKNDDMMMILMGFVYIMWVKQRQFTTHDWEWEPYHSQSWVCDWFIESSLFFNYHKSGLCTKVLLDEISELRIFSSKVGIHLTSVRFSYNSQISQLQVS